MAPHPLYALILPQFEPIVQQQGSPEEVLIVLEGGVWYDLDQVFIVILAYD